VKRELGLNASLTIPAKKINPSNDGGSGTPERPATATTLLNRDPTTFGSPSKNQIGHGAARRISVPSAMTSHIFEH
jgi:hypothetical protein